MKNLATCKPSEFLIQTNKIRKSVEKWLDATDIMNIRKRIPQYEVVGLTATPEEKAEINARNEVRKQQQIKKNLSDMFDSILERHPQETLEVMALCCFVEPENVDDHPMSEYLQAVNDLIGNAEVLNFFTLLVQLAQKNT